MHVNLRFNPWWSLTPLCVCRLTIFLTPSMVSDNSIPFFLWGLHGGSDGNEPACQCKRVPEKHLLLLYWLCQSLWLCRSQQTMENSSRDGNNQTTWPASWEICMQIKKQQLEPYMEQTGFKLGKEYVKAVYCHPAYLTYSRIHHTKCQTSWSTSWNQDCREKYQ